MRNKILSRSDIVEIMAKSSKSCSWWRSYFKRYGWKWDIIWKHAAKVLNSQLKWVTIDGMVAIPGYIIDTVGRENASEMILTEMAKSMATKLLPFMEFRSMMNPCDLTVRTHGRIRVAEPVVNRFGNTYMEMPRIDWRFMDEN